MSGLVVNPYAGPARAIRESGGTTLAMGAVADGQFLRRSGTGIVGAAVSSAVPAEAARIAQAALSDAFSTFIGIIGYTAGTGLGTGQLRARPWVPGKSGTLTGLGLICGTGVATSKARIGLYDSDANGYPGTLLAESGELDCATNGRKLTTGLSVTLDPSKVYWVAFLGGTAAPNLAVLNTNLGTGLIVATAAGPSASIVVGLTVAQSYGAMPASFPVGATTMSSASAIPAPLLLVS